MCSTSKLVHSTHTHAHNDSRWLRDPFILFEFICFTLSFCRCFFFFSLDCSRQLAPCAHLSISVHRTLSRAYAHTEFYDVLFSINSSIMLSVNMELNVPCYVFCYIRRAVAMVTAAWQHYTVIL